MMRAVNHSSHKTFCAKNSERYSGGPRDGLARLVGFGLVVGKQSIPCLHAFPDK